MRNEPWDPWAHPCENSLEALAARYKELEAKFTWTIGDYQPGGKILAHHAIENKIDCAPVSTQIHTDLTELLQIVHCFHAMGVR